MHNARAFELQIQTQLLQMSIYLHNAKFLS